MVRQVGRRALRSRERGLVRSSFEIFEDFEEGDTHTDEWNAFGNFTVVESETLEGEFHAESTGSGGAGLPGMHVARDGSEYRCRVRSPSSTATSMPGFLVNCQNSTDVFTDCYWLKIEPQNNRWKFHVRSGGSTVSSTNISATVNQDVTYEFVWIPTASGGEARLEELDGTTQGTHSTTDTTHTGGTVGIHEAVSDFGGKYDYLRGYV